MSASIGCLSDTINQNGDWLSSENLAQYDSYQCGIPAARIDSVDRDKSTINTYIAKFAE